MTHGNTRGIDLRYAAVPTNDVGMAWRGMTDAERMERIKAGLVSDTDVLAAKANGQVILQLKRPLTALERGSMLMAIEQVLKAHLDGGITVWLEPKADRNALRLLRGVEVKA